MPIQVRRFEYRSYKSFKFWECWCDGSTFHASWGPIGQDPRMQEKKFSGIYTAGIHMSEKIKEKKSKGYTEVPGRLIPDTVVPRKVDVEEQLLKTLRSQAVKELKAAGYAIDETTKKAMRKSLDTITQGIRENNLIPTPAHLIDLTVRELEVDVKPSERELEIPEDEIKPLERFQMLELD